VILRRDDTFAQVVVPDHKEIDRGTLRAIIRQRQTVLEENFRRIMESGQRGQMRLSDRSL